MCSPKPPKQVVTQPQAPLDAPKPLATPEQGASLNLSQLRIGSKNNLKMRSTLGIPPSA